MAWDVEYTDEFETWWINELDSAGRESVAAYIALLEDRGIDRWQRGFVI
jgi:hypothetical protein